METTVGFHSTKIGYSDKKSQGSDRGSVRRTLEDKFKQIYEVPKVKKQEAEMTFKPTVDNKKYARSHYDEEPGALTPHSQAELSQDERRSCRSSKCSECSGAAKRGMEYVCVDCLNKEMAEDKRRRLEYEREENNRYDATQRRRLEEEQARQREELEDLRRQMKEDLGNQALQTAERRRLEELERYKPT